MIRLSEIRHRAPEQGRIRYGVKTGRAMKALEVWRFTSPDQDAIERLAEEYGGTVQPWNDPKASPQGQWEVITESNSIAVWLPEDAYDITYELWGGKGLDRRCDGEACFNGATRETVPCLCAATDKELCKPYSRVQLILPTVGFGGTWRLEAKGWNFAYEAPGMIAAISQLQAHGLKKVNLHLSKRQSNGKHYIVPQFSLSESPEQIMSGMATVGAIGSPTRGRLELAASSEVVEAEVVLDPEWQRPKVELVQDEPEDAVVVEDEPEPEGWDDENPPPPHIRVRRNPDRSGPKWIRADASPKPSRVKHMPPQPGETGDDLAQDATFGIQRRWSEAQHAADDATWD